MDDAARVESPMGAVVPISGVDPLNGRQFEHFAFVPAPLPSQVELASSTWKQVAAAEAALGRLDQAAQQFPVTALLRRPALRREAQSTSGLEGTYAPFETIMASELDDRPGLPVEVREVLNYVVAAEEGFAWVADRPITVGLIERLQQLLVADTPGERYDSGQIRRTQVAPRWIVWVASDSRHSVAFSLPAMMGASSLNRVGSARHGDRARARGRAARP